MNITSVALRLLYYFVYSCLNTFLTGNNGAKPTFCSWQSLCNVWSSVQWRFIFIKHSCFTPLFIAKLSHNFFNYFFKWFKNFLNYFFLFFNYFVNFFNSFIKYFLIIFFTIVLITLLFFNYFDNFFNSLIKYFFCFLSIFIMFLILFLSIFLQQFFK